MKITEYHFSNILLAGDQVRRVYLDELGDVQQQPLGLGLMLLTIKEDTEAIETAKFLLAEARKQSEAAIIDLITTIIVYKFKKFSRKEIITMLGLDLEEPRAIQEAKEEEALSITLRLLKRRLGNIPDELLSRVQGLSLVHIEDLCDVLLDFATVADLERWLQQQ
jgi:predicted transposase YdaD